MAVASHVSPDPSMVELLKPFPSALMEAYPVSKLVNSPKNDGPEIIVRAEDPLSLFM